MDLPDHGRGPAIGPSDIIAYRDCPRRFAFGMRRHGEAGDAPEAQGTHSAYGSAVHDALAYLEEHDCSDADAIQHAVDRHGRWLEPEDLERMAEDLAVYHEREPTGVRTVAVEHEIQTPLMEFEGQTIWLRGRLDRLYQRLDNESFFLAVDYKSSRWPKTEAEVHADLQQWIYNLLIHEEWPECETLVQLYDQLRHGVVPTRKTTEQREQIRAWLIAQVTAILRDDELAPTFNQWCPWCPIMESCPVVGELSDYALGRIAALAPAEKQGRKTVLKLDPDRFEVYVGELERVSEARKVLERYETSVKETLGELPASRRLELGYDRRQRWIDVFGEQATRAVHEFLGDEDFYAAATLSKRRLEGRLGKGDRLDTVLGMAERKPGATVIAKVDD